MSWLCISIILATCIAIECWLTFWIPKLRRSFQWLITYEDEQPTIPVEGLKKFIAHGFDAELGWSRKPNTSASEVGGTAGENSMKYKKSSYSINEKGARNNPGHENYPAVISTYGDSFVFCRQVNDEQTFQWYLSKITKTNVSNYGVGNYGFDQALLRFKREYSANPTKIVIIGVVPETITRILSVWKHYYEYGNILGFKPRYFLDGKRLRLEPNPINSPKEFYNIKSHLKLIQQNDYFYLNKFKRDQLNSPYLISLFKNPSRNIPLVTALTLRNIKTLNKITKGKIDSKPWELVLKQNSNIVKELYKDSSATTLFLALIEEFINSAKNFQCTPVLLLMPYLHDVLYAKNYGSFYESFKIQIQSKLKVIDLMDRLINSPNLNSLFHTDFYGGHMSVEGNKWVAEQLNNELDINRYQING